MHAVSSFFINRNVVLLSLAQSFANTLQTMGIATTPLAAYMLLGDDKSLATLPIVFVHLGLMTATVPASLLMNRFGRRAGFSIGAMIGITSGAVGVWSVFEMSLWGLCLTSFLQGATLAVSWYYRFAAADCAPPGLRARAISLVLLGGILAGIIGPESAKWAKELLAPVTFAGVYVMFSVMCLITLLIVSQLTIPPPTAEERHEPARPMAEIARQPAFIVAVLSSMVGYGVMTVLMTATPLAMLGCGFVFEDSATVIQFHSVSMFAPALFTGYLIIRFGVLTIIGIGALLLSGAVVVAMSGITFANFLVANVLVGVGWNFCFIGGSTLLTTVYRTSERAKTQAAHDFAEYTMTAIAALMAGIVLAGSGWASVNLIAIPLILVVIASTLWLYCKQGHVELAAQPGRA